MHVAELWQQELVEGQPAGSWRTGQGDNDFAVADSGQGPAHHGCRTDLLIREHSKKFSKTVQFFAEQRPQSLNGRIARRNPSAASKDKTVDGSKIVSHCSPNSFRAVRENLVMYYGMTGILQHLLDQPPTLVGLRSPCVARGKDGDSQVRMGTVTMMLISSHRNSLWSYILCLGYNERLWAESSIQRR